MRQAVPSAWDKPPPAGEAIAGDIMKYEDPKMEEYFQSLPAEVKAYINASGADICSLGELTMIGEHFRHSLGCADTK